MFAMLQKYSIGMILKQQQIAAGCVSLFCTKEGGGKIREKRAGERQKNESEEEHPAAE
jgi:hypothetical protein